MPALNVTASATASHSIPTAPPLPTNGLAGREPRALRTHKHFQKVPDPSTSGKNPVTGDSKSPIPIPVYVGLLTANHIPDAWKAGKGAVFDQESLERVWSSIQDYLRTQPVSEKEVLQLLKSGILQTPTGQVLAPLWVDAIMRSIKPLDDLKPGQLREFVEIICHLPPTQWANVFGENVNLPRGANGEGVLGFIQTQLKLTRDGQEKNIAAGELLDDTTWETLNNFTKQARQYIRPSSETSLNVILRQLEDLIHIRPSPKEAKTLMAGFVEAMREPRPNERDRWSERFPAQAQKLNDQLNAIEIVDNRPDRSWLEEVIDPSKVTSPVKAALSKLGSMTLSDLGNELQDSVSLMVANVAFYLFSGTENEPAPAQNPPTTTLDSPLLEDILEIENRASLYNEVDTKGPTPGEGFAAKFLYTANVLDTIGVLGVAAKVQPFLPAVPKVAPVASSSPEADIPVDLGDMKAQVAQREKEVNAFIASLQPRAGNDTGGESNTTAQRGPSSTPEPSPAPSSAPPTDNILSTLEQLSKIASDALSSIDNALKFPEAMGNDELKRPLLSLQELVANFAAREAPSNDEGGIPLLERREQTVPHIVVDIPEEQEAESFLGGRPVYNDLVTTPPSWWESIATEMQAALSQLSAVLATYRSYAIGSATAAVQIIKDNPRATLSAACAAAVTTAFVAATALYNHYSEQVPEQYNTPQPDIESEALIHERQDDEVEKILDQPVAAGNSTVQHKILELMYQSAEHDLLDDEKLLQQVELLLEQPSSQNPAKTYAELILEAEGKRFIASEFVHEPDSDATKLIRVRRSAEPVIENTDDLEESTANQAVLTQYLKTMEALQSPDIDHHEEIGDGAPANPETEAARQVVRVLRRRRAVTWADSSCLSGDKALIPRYTRALLESVNAATNPNAVKVQVPMHSTFGQCWLNFVNAIKNPFFNDWAKTMDLDLSTTKVNTHDGSLSGKVKGVQTTFELADNTGWAKVAGPILKALKVVDPTLHGVPYPSGSGVEFPLLNGFYGEPAIGNAAAAQQRARELNADEAFPTINPDDPLRPLELRSEPFIASQKQYLGNLYTHHALVTGLKLLIADLANSASVNLTECLLPVHADSTFALKHPTEAQTTIDAVRFIEDSGWIVPTTKEATLNLIEALTFALPESLGNGNYWGALANDRALTTAQQNTVREAIGQVDKPVGKSLLDHLLQNNAVTSPIQGLYLALASAQAKTLGTVLEQKFDVAPTPSSGTEWAMAAMVLDLDATPGQPRNHVAGYNLTQEANWGAKPASVVTKLEHHLMAGGKVSSKAAPVAAYQLLLGIAPEFLAQKIPDNLVIGSHTWTTFRIAAARIEQVSPGTVPKMTFEQVMNYGEIASISVGDEIAAQSASVDPLIDWAIANGVLLQNTNDIYTEQQLKIVGEKFQEVREELARAQGYLTAPTPTRKDIALAELTRVFGKDLPYEDLTLTRKNTPQGVAKMAYSLLDLYITGEFAPGTWESDVLPVRRLEQKFSQLKNVNTVFVPEFNSHFDNLITGSSSIFKHLVAQLPPSDKKNLEYGKNTYYSVRSQTGESTHNQTPDKIEANKGRHGILIRTEHQQSTTYYEVFPSTVQIIKRSDITETPKLGGKTEIVKGRGEMQLATRQRFDWQAYQTGTAPKEGAWSDVIIEELKPVEQKVVLYPPGYDYNTIPNPFSPKSQINHMASVVVKEHFITGRDKLQTLAKGSTKSEEEEIFKCNVRDFFLDLVPFKSCVDNIIAGNKGSAALDCTLDAAGFVIPGALGAGKAIQIAKSGARFVPKVMKLTWMTGKGLVSSANPFDGIGSMLTAGKNVVGKLGTQAYSAAGKGIEQVKKLYRGPNAFDSTQNFKRADVTEGTCNAVQGAGQTSKVTALIYEGKWYAYDATRNRPYGTALDNFKPDSSISLERTTFSDGTTKLTPTKLFETEAHTIQRSTGVDVLVGDQVYRFDPEHPEVMHEITSAANFKQELEGFEAVCSIGGKSKRTGHCFSKIIDKSLGTVQERRAQATEHKRLYPTAVQDGVSPRVIHERRIYKCTSDYEKCNPDELTVPLQFKAVTTGNIIPNDFFGLPGKIVDNELNAASKVVRINAIVQGLDDAREVRAFMVNIPGLLYGKTTYLVAEADTGLFYYCKYDGKSVNNIEFSNISPLDEGLGSNLIKEYHKIKDPFISNVAKLPNNDFVSLPTLDYLYKELESIGWTPIELSDLKKSTAKLSEAQKRDLILTAMNRQGHFNIEVSIPAIKIEPIGKPLYFSTLSRAQKNEIYAKGATVQADKQISATGVGSDNKLIDIDPNDLQRLDIAKPVVLWQYSRRSKPGGIEMVLKTGAGNCDHMAAIAAKIILLDGGSADLWHMPNHMFTLVGGPPRGTIASTIDFSEPAFKDAWVVDRWAGITCPADQYIKKLEDQMTAWHDKNQKILEINREVVPNTGSWVDATDTNWMGGIQTGPKSPMKIDV